jgi:hypothetical protein
MRLASGKEKNPHRSRKFDERNNGQKPGPKQLLLEFAVGEQIDLASTAVNIKTRRTETVWTFEVRLTNTVLK